MTIFVLLDSLNNVGTWTLKNSSDDGESMTEEYVNGKSWLDIYYLKLNSRNSNPGEAVVEISFTVNGKHNVSGESGIKGSLEIFTVVLNSIHKMNDKVNPKEIHFSANIEDGSSEDKTGSRVRLYDRLASRIAGYKLEDTKIRNGDKEYFLTRADK